MRPMYLGSNIRVGRMALGSNLSLLKPPVNTAAPVASGTATVGNTLSVTNGTWLNTPTSYTYQWKRDTVAIESATNATYVLVEDDAGTSITCTVTAINAAGSTAATSNALAITGYDLDVVLLLPMTGANNSTTFNDISYTPHTMTPSGECKIVTTLADPFGQSNGVGAWISDGDKLVMDAMETIT